MLVLARVGILVCLLFSVAHGAAESLIPAKKPLFLQPDLAFQVSSTRDKNQLILNFKSAEGYYLYKNRFSFQSLDSGLKLGTAVYSRAAKNKQDPTFGLVPIFHDDIMVSIPVKGKGRILLNWQGCAEAGLCYPPQKQSLQWPLP